jgi:hypothetical protein
MPLRRSLALSIALLYAAAVSVAIVVLSGSPYEFMIGEMEGNRKITICNLPVPADNGRDVALPLTAALVLVLVITGVIHSVRSRRVTPALVLGGLLVLLWLYRFFLRTLGC